MPSYRRDLAALAAAALPALDAARKAFEAAAAPLPPFKRRPVLAGPALNMTGDEDGNTWPEGVGWALSWGCQLTFGRDDKTGVPYVQVSLSDDDRRRGITQRSATRAQVAEFARMLAEQFGEPAGPDPRDAEIERLRKEYDEAVVSGPLRETLDAEIERLRAQVDELAKIRVALFGEVRQALTEQAKAREEWQRADVEVTRLKRLVGNENVSYDGWDQLSRHDAIVRCEEGWQEYLKARDERDRLRQELDQHLADENSAQAANDRLRNEIQNHNAGHDGTMRYITNRLSDILDANTADIHELLNMVSLRVEGDDEASAELKRRELRRTFQPGQRVRIGLCNGIVVQPKDVTRVQLEGTLYDVDYPTRVVEPILNDDGEMPF